MRKLLLLLILFSAPALAQTQIQSGPVDPPVCDPTIGQLWFNNSTVPAVLKYCSATNTWSIVGTGSGATSFPWTTLSSTGTPSLTVNNGSANYFMSVTSNITSVTTSGSATNGTYIGIDFKEDATGGRTIPIGNFPGNFIFPTGCTFNTAANANNWLAWTFDGTNWQPVPGSCVSASVSVGPVGTVQTAGASGTFASSGETDDGTNFNVDRDFHPKGGNPWVDPMRFGARVLNGVHQTASCTATSNVVTIGGADQFINGDGVTALGCGATTAISTPAAPTVTTGNSGTLTVPDAHLATGATAANSYSALVVIEDLAIPGSATAAGPATTISNALPLGQQTASVTSASLTGNTLTLTFGSAPNVVVGTMMNFRGSTNALLSAESKVTATTATTLTFTVPNYAASTITSTGGTVYWFNAVQISVATPPANSQAILCVKRQGDSSYAVIGKMHPNVQSISGVDAAVTTFTDWGSPMITVPLLHPWITNSVCTAGAATAGLLTGTISSGAGSTSLTLSVTAGATNGSSTLYFDNGPAFTAADAAAVTDKSYTRIPASTTSPNSFYVYSPVTFNAPVELLGNISTAATLTFKNSLRGALPQKGGQFAWSGLSGINNLGGWPMTVFTQGDTTFRDFQLISSGNQALLALSTNGNQQVFQNFGCSPGTTVSNGGSDYTGMCLAVVPAAFNFKMDYIAMSGGPSNTDNASWTPMLYFLGATSPGNTQIWELSHFYMAPRAVYDLHNTSLGMNVRAKGFYCQGCVAPLVSIQDSATLRANFDDFQNDTSFEPSYMELTAGGSFSYIETHNLNVTSQEAGSFPLPYTGDARAIPGSNIGQNAGSPIPQCTPSGSYVNSLGLCGPQLLFPPVTSLSTPLAGVAYGFISTANWPSFTHNNGTNYNVAGYGTGAAAHTVPLLEGANPLTAVAPTANAQCFMSAPSSFATTDPSFQTCPSGFANPMTTLGDIIFENATPAAARLAGPTSPNGIPQTLTDTPSGGAAAAEQWAIPGVQVDAQTGTSYTVPITDDVKLLTLSNASPIAVTGFALANNYTFAVKNLGAGLVTYTPASGTVNGNATQKIYTNWFGFHYTDNTNTFMPIVPTDAAFPTCTGASQSLHVDFTANPPITCATLSASGVTLQTNTVNNTSQTTLNLLNSAAFNGLTFTFTNTSAGNVQAGFSGTLGNAGLTNSTIPINGTTCTLGTACSPPPNNCGSTDLTNSTTTASQTICTGPAAGHYLVSYYMDVNSSCPTGSDAWAIVFQWVDASGTTRSLQTGSMPVGTSQTASNYLEGTFSIWVNSGNVTGQPQHLGACASGNSTYDLHITGTGKLR